jgi:hypothetical protein
MGIAGACVVGSCNFFGHIHTIRPDSATRLDSAVHTVRQCTLDVCHACTVPHSQAAGQVQEERPLEVRLSIHLGTPVTLARAARPAEKPGRDPCATGTKIPALYAQTVLAHYVDMPLSVCSAGCWLWLSLTSPPSPREKLLSAASPSASGLGSGTCQRPRFNKLLVGNLPDSHRF